jgi:ribonuclease P protein subunit RPR2
MMRSGKKPEAWRKIARERIQILFVQAEREFAKHPERAQRYVELARKIGMRYKVRLKEERRKFCRKCNAYLKPGVNCRVRLRQDRQAVVVTCLVCGRISRHPYIKEKRIIKSKGERQ